MIDRRSPAKGLRPSAGGARSNSKPRPRGPADARVADVGDHGATKSHRPLSPRFFNRDTLDVAQELLGHLLVHEMPAGRVVGRIVEVEAYRGPRDPASHAYRLTPRSRIMWGPPGIAYVYFTYGNHYCMNVVTEPEGTAGAVLLRALEPVEGLDLMRANRNVEADHLLTCGPGRLTQAMGIGPQHNGITLAKPPLYLAWGRTSPVPVKTGPRIGIRTATDRPWRFFVPGSPFVSR